MSRRQEDFSVSLTPNIATIIYTQDYDQLILRIVGGVANGTFNAGIDGAGFEILVINAVPISAGTATATYVFTRNQSGNFSNPAAGSVATMLPLSNYLSITSTVAATLTIAASAQI